MNKLGISHLQQKVNGHPLVFDSSASSQNRFR